MNVFSGSVLSRSLAWMAAAFLAGSAVASHAAVLVTQAPLDDGNSYQVGLSSGQLLADNFTLTGAVSLQGFQWWGAYADDVDNGDDDFTIDLYSDVSGAGTVALNVAAGSASRSATALLDVGDNGVYLYEYTFAAPVALAAGTYHFSVANYGSSDWLWLASGVGDGDAVTRLDDPAESWTSEPTDLAFTVLGDPGVTPVSEPAGLALLGLAGLAMVATRRLQRP